MKKNLIYFLFLVIILASSCNKTVCGCTSEFAENFNPDATEDDNSCVMFFEQFIGSYETTSTCIDDSGSPDQFDLILSMSEISGSPDKVLLVVQGIGIPSIINRNSFSFDHSYDDKNFEGTGNLNGETLTVSMEITSSTNSDFEICNFNGKRI